MHFENRSRRRCGQKTSLFANDQVPFIGPHYIIHTHRYGDWDEIRDEQQMKRSWEIELNF